MLSLIGLSGQDTLYVLGDVIDRGPDGVRILQDMMLRPNVIPLLGNHEFMAAVCLSWLTQEITPQSLAALGEGQVAAFSDWVANGGEPTLRAIRQLGAGARAELLCYLREMELFAELQAGGRSFLLTHSGLARFCPARPLDDYELEDFLFCRPTLDTVYFADKLLVFGHTPTRFLCGEDRILRRESWVDIDCGCAAEDGRLGCLCLDTLEEFYL